MPPITFPNQRRCVYHNEIDVCRNAFSRNTKIPLFCIENSGICFWNVLGLLFPVVPDVLHIVVIFHGIDELLHQLIG